jgi:hypothetical protein
MLALCRRTLIYLGHARLRSRQVIVALLAKQNEGEPACDPQRRLAAGGDGCSDVLPGGCLVPICVSQPLTMTWVLSGEKLQCLDYSMAPRK